MALTQSRWFTANDVLLLREAAERSTDKKRAAKLTDLAQRIENRLLYDAQVIDLVSAGILT